MAYDKLKNLAATFPIQRREELAKFATKYRWRQEREVLELAAIATDVSIDDVTNLGLEPAANPQFLEAFKLQYPRVSLDSLRGATEERLEGFANGVKGKYFEVLVCKKLNAKESVGDIQLEPGQVARIAKDANQPGWDLRIEDSNGEVVEDLQLKATESMSYVNRALEKYPDIRVVVPDNLDEQASLRDNVIASSITNEYLEQETGGQLGELSEGTFKDLADKSAEFGVDAIPLASAVVIAATEGGMVLMGRSSLRDAMHRGRGRVVKAGVYSTIGTTLGLTPLGPIAIPTTMALRVTEGRIRNIAAVGDHMEEKTRDILRELERPAATSAEPA